MTIEDVIRDERRRAHKKRDLAEAFRDEANKIPALKHAPNMVKLPGAEEQQ